MCDCNVPCVDPVMEKVGIRKPDVKRKTISSAKGQLELFSIYSTSLHRHSLFVLADTAIFLILKLQSSKDKPFATKTSEYATWQIDEAQDVVSISGDGCPKWRGSSRCYH